MKKKVYEKPTTQVVQLQHQCHILAGSMNSSNQILYPSPYVEYSGDVLN